MSKNRYQSRLHDKYHNYRLNIALCEIFMKHKHNFHKSTCAKFRSETPPNSKLHAKVRYNFDIIRLIR
ncbi:hypothetical protein TcasGA2_TC014724 [Tribolium castaneum]|uniref:Uncharacterized protein n=1 Tax=Tribolium castaneum TaxID=7070 RepID=D6WP25_TRICA|nr:hypothetical protein TcasGA2_TC014724 [Tribolium castaneum]